jgi:hypothetical protein
MNLSDFSLLKEDDGSYTIGHPQGKSIQVGKKGLSEKAHALISKLKRHENFASGGEAEEPEEDSPAENEIEVPEVLAPAVDVPVTPAPVLTNIPSAKAQVVEGLAPPGAVVPEAVKRGPQTIPDDIPAQQQEVARAPAQQEAAPEPAPEPAAKPAADPYDPEKLLKNAIDTNRKSGEQAQKAYQTAADSYEKAHKTTEQLNADYQVQDQAFLEAMEKKQVDPDRYLNNMSTGSKIASAIGLMLSGIGAGIQGGENLALKQLNRAIDADIDAQKNDQSKTMNLWKMNREHYQNALAADLASKNQLLTLAEVKAKQAMATSSSAEAMARLAPQIAEMQKTRAVNNWAKSMLLGAPAGTEDQHNKQLEVLEVTNPAAAKDLRKRTVPTVGVLGKEPTPEDERDIRTYSEVKNSVNRALHFAMTRGSTGPGTISNAEAETLHANLITSFQALHGLKRLSKEDLDLIKAAIPNPGEFMNQQAIAKLQEFKRQVEDKQANTYKFLALKPFKQIPGVR